jgi:methylated-DNA-[protein]-cysteine S-methyltransferase
MTVSTDLDMRFRDAATRAGLVDAAFDVVDSPVGPLLVAATDRGILRISFDADPVRRELDEYFEQRRKSFDLTVDLRGTTPFTVQVLGELALVPYGQTATYGDLAARVGRPRAARAIGMVMNHNPIPIVLPCHRIVGSNGSLTGYGGGLDRKELLLRLEGAIL